MTTTQENARPIPLIGPAVGQAQASLSKILLGILAESGTSYQVYLGLQRLDALGGEATIQAYEHNLSDWLELDAAAAARLAGNLVAAAWPRPGTARSGSPRAAGGCARGSWPSPRRSPGRCWPRSTATTLRPPSGRWTRSPGAPGG